jgi:hypothetical protein
LVLDRAGGGLADGLVRTSNAATTNQISGTAFFEIPPVLCAEPPEAFNSYPPLVMRGSLNGCWYTHIDTARTTAGACTWKAVRNSSSVVSMAGPRVPSPNLQVRGQVEPRWLRDSRPMPAPDWCGERNRRLRECFRTGRFQRHHRTDDHYVRLPRSHPPRIRVRATNGRFWGTRSVVQGFSKITSTAFMPLTLLPR